MRHVRSLVALAALCVAGAALAQQAPADEPGWAKGRPKTDTAMKMAPVPAFPVPTPADQLPIKKFKLPPGFKVEIWASGVLDARGLRQGAEGQRSSSARCSSPTRCTCSRDGQARGQGHHRQAADGRRHRVSTRAACTWPRTRRSCATTTSRPSSTSLGEPKVIYDKLPGGNDHSWKYLRIKNDKLYFAIGAPCNICDPGE